MRHQRLNGRGELSLVTRVPIQRTQEDRDRLLGCGQCQHPLLQILPMVARIPVGDGNRLRIDFPLLERIGPRDRERGRVHVQLARTHAHALASLGGDAGKEDGGVVRIQPVQRTPQALVIQVVGADPGAQEMLHGLGGEELRDQIQAAVGKAQSIENHRYGRRADADAFMQMLVAGVQILREADFSADPGNDPQMIQALDPKVFGLHGGSSSRTTIVCAPLPSSSSSQTYYAAGPHHRIPPNSSEHTKRTRAMWALRIRLRIFRDEYVSRQSGGE